MLAWQGVRGELFIPKRYITFFKEDEWENEDRQDEEFNKEYCMGICSENSDHGGAIYSTDGADLSTFSRVLRIEQSIYGSSPYFKSF